MKEEFGRAREWVENELSFDRHADVSVFETTIRIVGGLMSTNHLTGARRAGAVSIRGGALPVRGPVASLLCDLAGCVDALGLRADRLRAGDEMFARRALELADRLLPAFQSETGVPYAKARAAARAPSHPRTAPSHAHVSR